MGISYIPKYLPSGGGGEGGSTESTFTTLYTDVNGVVPQVDLANDNLYTVDDSNHDLAQLSIVMNSSDFHYCALDFDTGTTAPTFGAPATWVFKGFDCDGSNVFNPKPNKHYRIAIERMGDICICGVQAVHK